MKVGDVVELEVPGEEPKHGYIIKVDQEDMHVLVCLYNEEHAKARFELLAREMVPA